MSVKVVSCLLKPPKTKTFSNLTRWINLSFKELIQLVLTYTTIFCSVTFIWRQDCISRTMEFDNRDRHQLWCHFLILKSWIYYGHGVLSSLLSAPESVVSCLNLSCICNLPDYFPAMSQGFRLLRQCLWPASVSFTSCLVLTCESDNLKFWFTVQASFFGTDCFCSPGCVRLLSVWSPISKAGLASSIFTCPFSDFDPDCFYSVTADFQ